jgi:glutamate--cysteine ligase
MFDVRLPELRPYAFEGNFGLERESLRVTEAGRMAQTPHPFPPDHPRIVRDFCENQTEINTGVHPTAEAAVAELKEIDATIRAAILPRGERLWTNSNPPAGL